MMTDERHSGVSVLDGAPTGVSGQVVIPALQEEVGYEAIALEPWQETFCWAYVVNGGHGQDAYLKAKPRVKETTARVEASKLLTLPTILKRIEEIQAENRKRWMVTADDVIEFHGRVMKTDRRLFFDEKGQRIRVHELSDDLAAIVDLEATYNKEAGVVLIPVIASRQKAADSLARIMGMDKSKMELSGPDGGPIQYNAADDLAKLDELERKFASVLNGAVSAT